MPKIIVDQPFKFAHHGYQVEEFEPGEEPVETTDECADVAVAEKWARLVGEAPPPPPPPPPVEPKPKAVEAAPENRDAAAKRSAKARG